MGGVTSQVCSAPTVCFHRHCSLQAGAPTPKTLINVFGQQQRTPISCCCVWGSAYENGCELNLILHRISEVAGNYHTAVIICSCPSGILAQFEKYGEKSQKMFPSISFLLFIYRLPCLFCWSMFTSCLLNVFLIHGMVLFLMWLFFPVEWLLVVNACICS